MAPEVSVDAKRSEPAEAERVEVAIAASAETAPIAADAPPVMEALTTADVAAAMQPPKTQPAASTYQGQAEPPSSFVAPKAPEPERSPLGKEPMKLVGGAGTPSEDEEVEVDRVLLAKEFSGLLQVETGDDEAST